MNLSKEEMYQAILRKDTSFEWIFFTAVKTTWIFCRPSCSARKPKIENVEFFKTTKECILKGYRPCKVCFPLEKLNETPNIIKKIILELLENPSLKLKDIDLKQRWVEPSYIRRWFLKNHWITFHAYQRIFRINSAFKKIQNWENISKVAFQSWFNSLSWFWDSFKKIFWISPKKWKLQNIINLKRIETPLGTMVACATDKWICLLEFSDRKMLETELKYISKKLNSTIIQSESKFFDILEKELNEYFDKKRKNFSTPLDFIWTDFQKEVWKNLLKISYWETKTYKEQAIKIWKLEAIRAVANANGMNKISILVPCHRVIWSDWSLTGYWWWLWRKKYLLDLEKSNN